MDVFDPRVLPICRQILLHKKQSLLNGLFDSADIPALNAEHEDPDKQLAFEMFEDPQEALNLRRQRLLYEIEHALAKMQNGVYGYCERTGRAIDRFRLLALPWTRYCADALSYPEAQEAPGFDLTSLDAL